MYYSNSNSHCLKNRGYSFILAAFDYLYQRWEFGKSIRMSKQEIKEEYKMVEGGLRR